MSNAPGTATVTTACSATVWKLAARSTVVNRRRMQPCDGLMCDETTDQCVGCLSDGDCDDGDSCTADLCDDGICTFVPHDSDLDGVGDCSDNCPADANPDQDDFDSDGMGDLCEVDVFLADLNLSGRVDGMDLAGVARAFASACGSPGYSPHVDFDRSLPDRR